LALADIAGVLCAAGAAFAAAATTTTAASTASTVGAEVAVRRRVPRRDPGLRLDHEQRQKASGWLPVPDGINSINLTVAGDGETRIEIPGFPTGTTYHVTVTCDNGLSTMQDKTY
jgi:hypothetical protein